MAKTNIASGLTPEVVEEESELPKGRRFTNIRYHCRYCPKEFKTSSGQLYHERHSHAKKYIPKSVEAKNQRKGVRKNARVQQRSQQDAPQDEAKSHRIEVATAYAWGHVELFVHSIASQYDVTFDELTRGLAAVIHAKAVR